jgi:hypothetical protein
MVVAKAEFALRTLHGYDGPSAEGVAEECEPSDQPMYTLLNIDGHFVGAQLV